MLIPLGFLASSGGGETYELIQTYVLGSSQASVTFSNLGDFASTYRHLQLRATMRDTRATTLNVSLLRFNGDAGSNYAFHNLGGNGSTVFSEALTSQTQIVSLLSAGANQTANAFAVSVVDILDPFNSTKNTTTRTLGGNNPTNEIRLSSGLWNNTASITSISITGNAGSFIAGSRFSLYGIR